MSVAIYEETKKDIDEAYRNKNTSKIEKETSFILNQLIVTMTNHFQDRLNRITIGRLDFKKPYIFSNKNWQSLSSWLNRFQELAFPISDLEFGKLKIDFEYWYYEIGGKEVTFEYRESYLLKPSEASEQLGISTVTLNKYIKQGFECVDTRSHHKIPKHAVEVFKDPVYAIKMQMLAQKKKIENQSPEERIIEINEELLEFQKKYKKKSWKEAFNGYEVNVMDDPSEYYEWRDLEEEKESLITKLIEDNNHE
ncbi:DNA-binding protein [Metabacillus indicus]|uniref:DNA-binding protein n=1 Tax=Metabacillus indicus TaxID=246786 RepID=UPI003CE725C9